MADKLHAAANAALLPALAEYGFTIVGGTSSGRGSSVTVSNQHASIEVTADWLEGELTIDIGRLDEPLVPLGSLVDLEGVSLSRLSRGVSRGQLESRLQVVVDRIVVQASSLLDGSNE